MLTRYFLTVRTEPGALAGRARVLDDRPGAAAARARLGDREQALALGLDAAALAARADLGRRARLGAGAVAGRAALRGRDGERDLRALDRLLEGDRDLGLEVAAALGAGAARAGAPRAAAAAAAAEEVGEDVARSEPASKPPAPPPPGPPPANDAAAVVLLALVGVAEDVVGRRDLLEALLGLLVARVAVRVVLARELAVGLLDLVRRRLLVDAEDLVEVALGHVAPSRHDDLGGPQDVVAVAVAGAGRPRRRARPRRRRRAAGPRPRGGGGRSARPWASRARCPTRASAPSSSLLHEADAVGQVVVAVLGLGLGGRQRALEVVQRRQQLARELGDAARLGGADVAARALATLSSSAARAQPLVLVVGLGLGAGAAPPRPRPRSAAAPRARRRGSSDRAARADGLLGRRRLSLLVSCSGVTTCPRPRPRRRRRPPRPRRRRRPSAPSAVAPLPCAAAACCWARSYIASETLWNAVCSASVLALISSGSSEVSDSRTVLDGGLDLGLARTRRPARRGP